MKYSAICACLALVGMANPGTALAYGLNRSESGEPLRWATDAVAFRLHPTLEDAMPDGHAYAAVTMAFEAWRGLPRVPDLLLVSGMPEDAGHHHQKGPTNGIYLVREWEGEPDQLAITVVTYSKSTGRVLDADILVNANAQIELLDETVPSEMPQYDLGAILTHEAGHSLGLDESETHREATMWPRVSPGETHQRTLSHDDEEGAIANYAGHIPEVAAGCGQASVLGRPSQRGPALLLGLAMLLLCLGFARSALRRGLSRRTMAFGLGTLLVAVPGTGDAPEDAEQQIVAQLAELESSAGERAEALLARAAHDERASVRLGAVRTLERVGAPEQRALAARLAEDGDPSVAQAARRAMPLLLARVPAQWQSEASPAARARIARAFGPEASMRALVRGRAATRAAGWQDGFIVTEHVVRDASGKEHSLKRRGGSVGDVTQRLLHTEAGPVDGAEVIVDASEHGAKRWAYHHDGYVFGGSLGQGPAIRLSR